MSFQMKAIKPKASAVEYTRVVKIVQQTMEEVKDNVLVDFKQTTSTWQHDVPFTASRTADGFTVGTDDAIYGYVDQGTKPHIIEAKAGKMLAFSTGGSPKSRVRSIIASRGSKGSKRVFARRVRHPGTKARGFSSAIQEKWQGELPQLINERIGGEFGD